MTPRCVAMCRTKASYLSAIGVLICRPAALFRLLESPSQRRHNPFDFSVPVLRLFYIFFRNQWFCGAPPPPPPSQSVAGRTPRCDKKLYALLHFALSQRYGCVKHACHLYALLVWQIREQLDVDLAADCSDVLRLVGLLYIVLFVSFNLSLLKSSQFFACRIHDVLSQRIIRIFI